MALQHFKESAACDSKDLRCFAAIPRSEPKSANQHFPFHFLESETSRRSGGLQAFFPFIQEGKRILWKDLHPCA